MQPVVRRIRQLEIALVVVILGASVLRPRGTHRPVTSVEVVRPALQLQGFATMPDTLPPFSTLDVRVQLLDLQPRTAARTVVSQSRGQFDAAGRAVPWQLTVPAGDRSPDSQLLVVISLLADDRVRLVGTAPMHDVTSARRGPGLTRDLPILRLQRVPDDATP